ncbi:CHFR ligase, partial [Polypterus senegalus]
MQSSETGESRIGQPWGKLVRVASEKHSVILLFSKEFIIGGKKDILNSEAPGSPFSCSEISSGDSNQPNLTNEEPSSDEPVPSTSMSDLHNTPSIFSSPSEAFLVYSLQPCMHTFCAACYSGWMERSSFCPTCRCPVERIRKNHMLNNLVEAYLLQHPEKCRSAEELQNMDSRNKISQDMVQPKVERNFSDEEGSSDYLLELSDVDSESSDISPIPFIPHHSQPWVVCRQCPWYRKDLCQPAVEQTVEAPLRTVGEAPSTSSSTSTDYRITGNAVLCYCCGLRSFKELAYQYRQSIPRSELPALVTSRPDCYWGRNCRTQVKAHHAM